MFSGMFGISTLIMSLKRKEKVKKQIIMKLGSQENKELNIDV